MTSEEEDDTLPLPGLSQEHFVDVTVDEDFIPTSQPKSFSGAKTAKVPESGAESEEQDPDSTSATELLPSVINDTIPADSLADEFLNRDKSADFIPETEMKKGRVAERSEQGISCQKKLTVTEGCDSEWKSQLESGWEKEISRVSESPVLETQSFSVIDESLPNEDSLNEAGKNNFSGPVADNTAMTEILVDDSVETVDLDKSGNSPVKGEKKDVKVSMEAEISCSINSDLEKCDREETQIFDNSSVLLLDQPEPSPSFTDLNKDEKPPVVKDSQQLYLCETIDDNVCSPPFEEKNDNLQTEKSLPAISKVSNGLDQGKRSDESAVNPKHESFILKEEQKNSSTESQPEESSSTPLETKIMDFNLHITCQVTFNPKTKKVNEFAKAKAKAKPVNVELISDNASDKSKRYSASSSGSVYSDKTGIPFALPKRVSAVSDQTDASDSSEDGFAKCLREGKKAFERIPWSNEYLVLLKMDELMTLRLENQDSKLNRSIKKSSPTKLRSRHQNGLENLGEEVSESLSSEQTSINNSVLGNGNEAELKDASQEDVDSKEMSEKAHSDEMVNSKSPLKSKTLEGFSEMTESCVNKEEKEEPKGTEKEHITAERLDTVDDPNRPNVLGSLGDGADVLKADGIEKQENEKATTSSIEASKENEDEIQLCEGLEVFARWTDRKYYPGILAKTPKYDRWEIKFDDGTIKNVREDFVMPSKWLKAGELVFVLVEDKYVSGQIIKITPGEEVSYTVELDIVKKQIDVKRSDLCLTDLLAGIVKEKYKPLCATPGKRCADINFDNVLSGKRLREQKTPLKPTTSIEAGSSSSKKKFPRGKKDTPDVSSEKNSHKENENRMPGLQSENGHLVPDKIISAESSSTTDKGETPTRARKQPRGKTKPRTLCYEAERYLSSRKKSKYIKEGLAPDGTPIPGPSGVKFKKQKTKVKKTPPSDKSESSSPTEEITIPVRPMRSTGACVAPESKRLIGKNSKSTKKSSTSSKNDETEKKGKRKYNMDGGEEVADDEPPAKSAANNKIEVVRKKSKTKKE